MLEKVITYKDYNGVERTETFHFNLNEAELTEMNILHEDGLRDYLERIIKAKRGREIMAAFKDFILKSYGEKADNGRRFMKSEELSLAFSQTEAYNQLFTELVTDAKKGADFIAAVLPRVSEAQQAQVEAEVARLSAPNN